MVTFTQTEFRMSSRPSHLTTGSKKTIVWARGAVGSSAYAEMPTTELEAHVQRWGLLWSTFGIVKTGALLPYSVCSRCQGI